MSITAFFDMMFELCRHFFTSSSHNCSVPPLHRCNMMSRNNIPQDLILPSFPFIVFCEALSLSPFAETTFRSELQIPSCCLLDITLSRFEVILSTFSWDPKMAHVVISKQWSIDLGNKRRHLTGGIHHVFRGREDQRVSDRVRNIAHYPNAKVSIIDYTAW